MGDAPGDRDDREQKEAEDREAILQRRARFVAAAIAGLASVTSCDAEPQACLEVAATSGGGGAAGEGSGGAGGEGGEGGRPRPCLFMAPGGEGGSGGAGGAGGTGGSGGTGGG